MEVKMHLESPEQNALVGVSTKPVVKNPFYDANSLEAQGKYTEAEALYIEMLNNDFTNVVVMAALGMNYAVQGKHGLANVLMSKSLNEFDRFPEDLKKVGIITKETHKGGTDHFLKTKKSELMNALGTTWKHENKLDKARYWFEKAQNCIGDVNADIQNNLATLYINEGNPAGAISHLSAALAAQPDHAQAHWNRSLANLELGKYEEGFAEYSWGKRAQVRMNRNYGIAKTPEWDGKPGKTVVVYGEQGIGDEIMFASILPELIRDCKQVIFDCHKKLHRLFSNSFPMVDIYPTREDENLTWPIKPDGASRYPVDAAVAIGDLPKFYRKEIADFPGMPFLMPTQASNLKWAQKLNETFTDGKPIIGINWIGGHKKTRVEVRSLTLEQLLPILKQDAHFVSLQYTPCEDEIFEFEQKHGIKIHHWPDCSYNEHYDETGGMVANLDLVVTCCSSIVHLAGAIGTPCWVLTPSRPAWRYRLDLDFMPWYGQTVSLFRQATNTVVWEPVVEEVSNNLKELLGARNEVHTGLQESPTGDAQPWGLRNIRVQACGSDSESCETVEYTEHTGLRVRPADATEGATVPDHKL